MYPIVKEGRDGMKKYILLLLSLLFLAVPTTALAAPFSLARVSSSAQVHEEETVQVISYKAHIRVESDIAYTTASLIIKNADDETQASLMLGLPSHVNQNTVKIDNPQVVMDGVRQRLSNRRDRTKPEETDIVDLPARWSTWTIKLDPDQYQVIEIHYETEIQKSENGTKSLFIPLSFLKSWAALPQNVEITADLGDAPPYIFEPNPTVLPHSYDNKSRISWKYSGTRPPEYIQVNFRHIEQLAAEYLTIQAAGDKAIASIIRAFSNKAYDTAISLVESYIETQGETFLNNELLYIEALARQNLLQANEAMELFTRLEDKPVFGELEGTFKNKIIYDKFHHMESLLTDGAALYEYLDSAKKYIMGNEMFLMWMEEELTRLTPPPTPSPEPTPPADNNPLPEPEDKDKKDDELITSIVIGDYEVSVEVFFLGVLAVLIILMIVISRRRRKARSRGYLFR
jgi:hypothetical protein